MSANIGYRIKEIQGEEALAGRMNCTTDSICIRMYFRVYQMEFGGLFGKPFSYIMVNSTNVASLPVAALITSEFGTLIILPSERDCSEPSSLSS